MQERVGSGWFGIGLMYALSIFALPTSTGFFIALDFLRQSYLPFGLIALADLLFCFFFLGRTRNRRGLSDGMKDAMKLNLLLGVLAWTFYFMPAYGPLVGKWIEGLALLF